MVIESTTIDHTYGYFKVIIFMTIDNYNYDHMVTTSMIIGHYYCNL